MSPYRMMYNMACIVRPLNVYYVEYKWLKTWYVGFNLKIRANKNTAIGGEWTKMQMGTKRIDVKEKNKEAIMHHIL